MIRAETGYGTPGKDVGAMRASRSSARELAQPVPELEDEAVVAVAIRPEDAWEPAPVDAWLAFYRELEAQQRVTVPQVRRVPVGRPAIHGRRASSI
jgi:hypothetical protein